MAVLAAKWRHAATRHRRVADQGAQIRRLPGLELHRRVVARPHPRPAAGRRRRARQVQGRAVGPARRQRRRTTSSRSTSSARRRRRRSPSSRACSRTSTSSTWPRTGTARARPSPGTCWRPSSRHPGQADGVPRDHRAGDPGGRREPARPGRRPGRRPGDPPHPGPAVRLRGHPGAVEEGDAASCRRAGCSRWPPASSCSANASGWRSAPPPTGTSLAELDASVSDPQAQPPTFTARLATVDGAARGDRPRLRLARRGRSRPTRCCVLDEARRPQLAAGLRGAQLDRRRRSRRSPTPAGRTRRS